MAGRRRVFVAQWIIQVDVEISPQDDTSVRTHSEALERWVPVLTQGSPRNWFCVGTEPGYA